MPDRRGIIAGSLVTTWGGAWIAALLAAANAKGPVWAALIHGPSLVLLIFGAVCGVLGALALTTMRPASTAARRVGISVDNSSVRTTRTKIRNQDTGVELRGGSSYESDDLDIG